MAYSDFTVQLVKETFGVSFEEGGDYFANVHPVPVSDLLRQELKENTALALAISSEKARSELIIMPVLMEVRRQKERQISLFSGVEFSVDPARGLKGNCDFLLSLSKEQLAIESPVIAIAEAKREDFTVGFGQCAAEMIAAQIFNQQKNVTAEMIYGVVTTGNLWRFLRLAGNQIWIDEAEYHIANVEKIVGIILSMLRATAS